GDLVVSLTTLMAHLFKGYFYVLFILVHLTASGVPSHLASRRESGVFKQEFLASWRFCDAERPLVFVSLTSIEPRYSYDVMDAARQAGAGVLLLDIRYSGSSLPRDDFSVGTLKKLHTIWQSVEDVALFGRRLREETPNMKIVVFGCSTSGTVAAMARVHHPDIFLGAVLSSPGLKFKLVDDLEGFGLSRDDVVLHMCPARL
ncbi:Thymus-specific serine protease, partial [Perkinsus chesapeaki]